MKHHRALFCALVLASVCATSGMAKPTSKAPIPLADSDKDFLNTSARGNLYDLSLAQLAAGRATDPALHDYGVELISDHAHLDADLLTLGRNKGLALPVTLSDEDKTHIDNLQTQSGSDLDNALIAEFMRINTQDMEDGQKELSTTHDAAVKRTVTETVKIEDKHLRGAQNMQKRQALLVIK